MHQKYSKWFLPDVLPKSGLKIIRVYVPVVPTLFENHESTAQSHFDVLDSNYSNDSSSEEWEYSPEIKRRKRLRVIRPAKTEKVPDFDFSKPLQLPAGKPSLPRSHSQPPKSPNVPPPISQRPSLPKKARSFSDFRVKKRNLFASEEECEKHVENLRAISVTPPTPCTPQTTVRALSRSNLSFPKRKESFLSPPSRSPSPSISVSSTQNSSALTSPLSKSSPSKSFWLDSRTKVDTTLDLPPFTLVPQRSSTPTSFLPGTKNVPLYAVARSTRPSSPTSMSQATTLTITPSSTSTQTPLSSSTRGSSKQMKTFWSEVSMSPLRNVSSSPLPAEMPKLPLDSSSRGTLVFPTLSIYATVDSSGRSIAPMPVTPTSMDSSQKPLWAVRRGTVEGCDPKLEKKPNRFLKVLSSALCCLSCGTLSSNKIRHTKLPQNIARRDEMDSPL